MDESARTEFLRRKDEEVADSRQRLALQILVGIDLDAMLRTPQGDRIKLAARLRRALERERMRGLRRHWCYDLNRHIALKQALDRLSVSGGAGKAKLESRHVSHRSGRRRSSAQ